MTQPFFTNSDKRELVECILIRNRPMLTALEMCAEELERFAKDDADVRCALRCARMAIKMEIDFRASLQDYLNRH